VRCDQTSRMTADLSSRNGASCAGEDLWHVYNLVRTGDLVSATTFRKIQRDSGAGQESEKIKLKLSIRVETIDFDPEGLPYVSAKK
jgi:eRF1 domain 1